MVWNIMFNDGDTTIHKQLLDYFKIAVIGTLGTIVLVVVSFYFGGGMLNGVVSRGKKTDQKLEMRKMKLEDRLESKKARRERRNA